MDLLKVIIFLLAIGFKFFKKIGEKFFSFLSYLESKKEYYRKKVSGSSGELFLEDGIFYKFKKMKSFYVNIETLIFREFDGLKMKFIFLLKEKGSSFVDEEFF